MLEIPLVVARQHPGSRPVLPEQIFLPDAYRLPHGAVRGPFSPVSPRVVFIEVTNRCNLLCATCPRTFFDREPLKTLSYAEFVQIAEQFPDMRRALLHGIGEPLLNRQIPFLASAGILVVLLSVLGGSLIIAEQLRGDQNRIGELEDAVRALTEAVSPMVEQPPRVSRSNGRVRSRSVDASST